MGNSKSRHTEYKRSIYHREGLILKTGNFLVPDITEKLKYRWFKLNEHSIEYYRYYEGAAMELKNKTNFDKNFKILVEDRNQNESVLELVNF